MSSLSNILTACYLCVSLANLINIPNPEIIVLRGGLANIGDMLIEPAVKEAGDMVFRRARQKVCFVRAKPRQNCAVVGAAAFALREIGEADKLVRK